MASIINLFVMAHNEIKDFPRDSFVSKNSFNKLPNGMKAMNPLPKLRFERDDNGNVKGFTFIHHDGREEFFEKDDKSLIGGFYGEN